MNKLRSPARRNSRILFFLSAALVFLAGNAWAVGPVDFGSVPGGATRTDSDGGSGEQWGRTGGRTITYTDFVIGNFSYLNWQPLTVGLAFDGEITGGTLEEMSGPVSIGSYTLQWNGETTITNAINNSIVPVYTRFTVVSTVAFDTLSDNIDIIAAGGDFEINLLFEASTSAGGPFQPALNFFDAYPTVPGPVPPAAGTLALTSFSSGFFFEGAGMTLEEHDTNMQGRFNNVDGALEFLTIESVNRLSDIGAKVNDNGDKIDWIKMDIQTLLGAGSGNLATSDDINDLMQRLNETANNIDSIRDRFSETDALILCAWIGDSLFPVCPPPAAGQPNLVSLTSGQAELLDKILWLKTDMLPILDLPGQIAAVQAGVDGVNVKVDDVKTELAALAAGISGEQKIDVSIEPADGEDMFMVLTSLNGLPTDAEITSVTAISTSKKDGTTVDPAIVTAIPVITGVQSLEIDFAGKTKPKKTLLIKVEHIDAGGNTLHGSLLIGNN